MFILTGDYSVADPLDPSAMVEAYSRYRKYLEENRRHFPEDIFNFVLRQWNDDPEDHQLLHDSWLHSLEFQESSGGNVRERALDIKLSLLGSFHDGHTVIRYSGVTSYRIYNNDSISGQSDLIRSELRLSDLSKNFIHEIEWRTGDRWLIECQSLSATWDPIG